MSAALICPAPDWRICGTGGAAAAIAAYRGSGAMRHRAGSETCFFVLHSEHSSPVISTDECVPIYDITYTYPSDAQILYIIYQITPFTYYEYIHI